MIFNNNFRCNLLYKCNFAYKNTLHLLFDKCSQQRQHLIVRVNRIDLQHQSPWRHHLFWCHSAEAILRTVLPVWKKCDIIRHKKLVNDKVKYRQIRALLDLATPQPNLSPYDIQRMIAYNLNLYFFKFYTLKQHFKTTIF